MTKGLLAAIAGAGVGALLANVGIDGLSENSEMVKQIPDIARYILVNVPYIQPVWLQEECLDIC